MWSMECIERFELFEYPGKPFINHSLEVYTVLFISKELMYYIKGNNAFFNHIKGKRSRNQPLDIGFSAMRIFLSVMIGSPILSPMASGSALAA